MITVFQEVSLPGVKWYKCACGRRVTRKKKFYQTINPYNKNAQGEIKSRQEILLELSAESTAWHAKTDPCAHGPLLPRKR